MSNAAHRVVQRAWREMTITNPLSGSAHFPTAGRVNNPDPSANNTTRARGQGQERCQGKGSGGYVPACDCLTCQLEQVAILPRSQGPRRRLRPVPVQVLVHTSVHASGTYRAIFTRTPAGGGQIPPPDTLPVLPSVPRPLCLLATTLLSPGGLHGLHATASSTSWHLPRPAAPPPGSRAFLAAWQRSCS